MEQRAHGRDLVGSWSLKSFEIRRDDGPAIHPFGEQVQGSLIYTASGRMSAQLMRSDRPTIEAGDQMKATAGEMEANYKGYWFDGEALRARKAGDSAINYYFLQPWHVEQMQCSGMDITN